MIITEIKQALESIPNKEIPILGTSLSEIIKAIRSFVKHFSFFSNTNSDGYTLVPNPEDKILVNITKAKNIAENFARNHAKDASLKQKRQLINELIISISLIEREFDSTARRKLLESHVEKEGLDHEIKELLKAVEALEQQKGYKNDFNNLKIALKELQDALDPSKSQEKAPVIDRPLPEPIVQVAPKAESEEEQRKSAEIQKLHGEIKDLEDQKSQLQEKTNKNEQSIKESEIFKCRIEKKEGQIKEEMQRILSRRPKKMTHGSPEHQDFQTKVGDQRGKLTEVRKILEVSKTTLTALSEDKKKLKQELELLSKQLIETTEKLEALEGNSNAQNSIDQASILPADSKAKEPVATSEDQPLGVADQSKDTPKDAEKKQAQASPKQVRQDSLDAPPSIKTLEGEIESVIKAIETAKKDKKLKKEEKAIQIKALQDALVDLLVQKAKIKAKKSLTVAASSQNGSSPKGADITPYVKRQLVEEEIKKLKPGESQKRTILEDIESELNKEIIALTAAKTQQYHQPVESSLWDYVPRVF